jgi:hypothetical protein
MRGIEEKRIQSFDGLSGRRLLESSRHKWESNVVIYLK